MSRIVHLKFDRSGQSAETYTAAKALEPMPTSIVSSFILAATKHEKEILHVLETNTPMHHDTLKDRPDIKMIRIVHCHAQLMALVDAMRAVVCLTNEEYAATQAHIIRMAVEHQQIINADYPLVQELWDAYAYLNGDDEYCPRLNHSLNKDDIAVNLNHFIEVAPEHRQQIPLLRDLKKYCEPAESISSWKSKK